MRLPQPTFSPYVSPFGDADESGTATVTATDALVTLRAVVGIASCTHCRCDVDASGTVTASDALALLGAATGVAMPTVCVPCT